MIILEPKNWFLDFQIYISAKLKKHHWRKEISWYLWQSTLVQKTLLITHISRNLKLPLTSFFRYLGTHWIWFLWVSMKKDCWWNFNLLQLSYIAAILIISIYLFKYWFTSPNTKKYFSWPFLEVLTLKSGKKSFAHDYTASVYQLVSW